MDLTDGIEVTLKMDCERGVTEQKSSCEEGQKSSHTEELGRKIWDILSSCTRKIP